MCHPPPRAYQTPLTDDILLLFDALFDHDDTLGALRRRSYAECQNLPYTHGLDDEALERAVEDLARLGLIATRQVQNVATAFVGLTEAGGRLWEIQRAPIWARFVKHAWWIDDASGDWRGAVWSPERSAAEAYLLAARRYGLLPPEATWDIPVIRERCQLLPWKTFARAYEFRLRPPFWSAGGVDWDEVRRCRTWWRDITELVTLRDRAP